MESQSSATYGAPSINHLKTYQNKWAGVFLIAVTSLLSIYLASGIYQIWWRTRSDNFELIIVVFFLSIPFLSFYVAWKLSRDFSLDPAIRKAIMWTTLRGISEMLFATYMLMMLIKDVYRGSLFR